METLILFLAGTIMTLVALLLGVFYVVFIVVGVGWLGTIVEQRLNKAKKQKPLSAYDTRILAHNPQKA